MGVANVRREGTGNPDRRPLAARAMGDGAVVGEKKPAGATDGPAGTNRFRTGSGRRYSTRLQDASTTALIFSSVRPPLAKAWFALTVPPL